MQRKELISQIFARQSYLCVGLDTDPGKIPPHLAEASTDPVFSFNQAIIDATRDLCVAYKINTAFYESRGAEGWRSLERTVDYIGEGHFRIADAKRGDIGNTSAQYARAFFEVMDFDAVTVAPYMGRDSVSPFLDFPSKWSIVLALTSNAGSADFQFSGGEVPLYERVITRTMEWGSPDNLMFVVGATRDEQLQHVRSLAPEHFFLVPGVGAQGGDLGKISALGLTADGGLLVNASRAILYAGSGKDFAERAREVASGYQREMAGYLQVHSYSK
jgi:orotidine-5'-phosphate decarboxylase